jgi:hypothetical protein
MKYRRVLGESHRYWNIKGRYRFAVVFRLTSYASCSFRGTSSNKLWYRSGTTFERRSL